MKSVKKILVLLFAAVMIFSVFATASFAAENTEKKAVASSYVNEKGELIGINNAGNGNEQNINYAIPLSIVKGVAENVMYYYNDGNDETNGVYKATIGITVSSEKSRYIYNETAGYGEIVENIILSTVESGSIAETIGLQIGDRLVSIKIGDTVYALNRYFDIADGLLSLTVGTQFSFVYERSGEEHITQTYTITAGDVLTVA